MIDPSPSDAGPVVKLFGAFLMAVGGLLAVLSGLCSLTVFGTLLLNIFQHRGQVAGLGMALPILLIFGGGPLAVGVSIFVWGRKIYQGR